MSETTTIVSAGATTKVVCDAVVGACKAAYRALTWIPDQALKEMERLEKELNDSSPIRSASFDACQEFEQRYAYIKEKLVQSPILKNQKGSIAQVLALRNSTLGSFVSKSQWNQLSNTPVNRKSFKNILSQATKTYSQANANYISKSIIDVASQNGFDQQRVNRYRDSTRFLTLTDNEGRGLVAQVTESTKGAQIHLDLTGFGDHSCHQVMDSILEGLKRKQIVFDRLQRRSHYCRESENRTKKKTSHKKNRRENKTLMNDERRRRIHHNSERIKLKN